MIFCGPIQPGKKPVGGLYLQFELVLGSTAKCGAVEFRISRWQGIEVTAAPHFAVLSYTFGNRPNLNLRVNNFEAHYATGVGPGWHDHSFDDWGDFRYNMDCTSGGCSGDSVEAKWYASDTGDPSGWVGGVVSDQDNSYAGSFVAEKD